MNDKILLIDGNSIMNRAFYGIGTLTNSAGLNTNAIFGFINILLKTIEEEKAGKLAVAFDLKAPTFRHEMYKDYKGNRKGMPDELREQMPVIKELLKKMNISIFEMEGYEADDILGTLAVRNAAEGYFVTVLSGDRDMLQLATDRIKISIPKTKNRTTTTEHYYENDVIEAYNIPPKAFIDVKGLMGDTSDNIPGIAGIGEKTALKLIEEYKDLDNLYSNLDKLKGKLADKISENKDIAYISKKLATIETKVPLDNTDISGISYIFNEEAYQMIKQLEFKSLLDRFESKEQQTEKEFSINIIDNVEVFEEKIKSLKECAYHIKHEDDNVYIAFAENEKIINYAQFSDTQINPLKICLENLLNNKDIIKVTTNLKEQLHYLSMDLDTNNKSIYELSLAAYLLNPLKDTYYPDDIARDYLDFTVLSEEELIGKGKSKKKYSELENDILVNYISQCAQTYIESYPIIKEQLKKENALELYENIELPLLYVLKNMEAQGIKIDSEMLKEYGNQLALKINDLEGYIYELAGESFNINSPKQLGIILFEKLELPAGKKNKTSYSTAADVLEKLKKHHPIVDKILEYRQLTKLKSTYADGLFEYIKEDKRIHSTFNQMIASTGRISSTEPNLQNIPIRLELGRVIRKVFIPEAGSVFIDADYSQIELRVLAHLSQDSGFIDAFNNNLDIHTATASQVFHTPYDEVTTSQRRNAKAVNFGIVYGISAYGLSEDLNIGIKEASDYIEQYFQKYPNVKTFLDSTVEMAKKNGYVTTMFNRKRMIPELSSSNFMQRGFGERIAMNTPIQGSAADIIKIAMINVYRALSIKNLNSKMLLQVHDELLIECPEDEADIVQELLINEMEKAVKLSVPLIVDAHKGNNWYELK